MLINPERNKSRLDLQIFKSTKLSLCIALLIVPLLGCGQKGALYLPAEKEAQKEVSAENQDRLKGKKTKPSLQ